MSLPRRCKKVSTGQKSSLSLCYSIARTVYYLPEPHQMLQLIIRYNVLREIYGALGLRYMDVNPPCGYCFELPKKLDGLPISGPECYANKGICKNAPNCAEKVIDCMRTLSSCCW